MASKYSQRTYSRCVPAGSCPVRIGSSDRPCIDSGTGKPESSSKGWCDVGQLDEVGVDDAPAEMTGPRDDERHPDQAFVEAAALLDEPVVTQHLAVIAGEDNDRVLPLASFFWGVENSAHLRVDQRDHRVVGGLEHRRIVAAFFRPVAVVDVQLGGMPYLGLEIDAGEPALLLDVAVPE